MTRFVFLALSMALPSLCQIPPGYYDLVDDATPALLRQTLHEAIDDHTKIPYSSSETDTWDVLEDADEDPENSANIVDLYKNLSIQKFGGGMGPYNREHSWPKSYGFPDDGDSNYPYTDCHHLFLCDVDYNGARGNKPFRFCSSSCSEYTTVLTNGTGGGLGVYPGNSNWTSGDGVSGSWETWIERRGDVARALFYMAIRYEGGNHGITGYWEPDLELTDDQGLIASSATGNNETQAYMGLLSVLLIWHDEDPVDIDEEIRNDIVYGYQGNRNPFVDHPEWVDCLFLGNCNGSSCPALFDLWATAAISDCTLSPYSVLDFVSIEEGFCSCPE